MSAKSGHVFERRVVKKALAASGGKCPVTGVDLTEDDLISVRVGGSDVRPIPASAATLPGLLTHMQNEWDAVMLESHNLRQSLAATRQELAHSLYQYDAATRVIARLVKERDEARKALDAKLKAPIQQPSVSEGAMGSKSPTTKSPAGAAPSPQPDAKGDESPKAMDAVHNEGAAGDDGAKDHLVPSTLPKEALEKVQVAYDRLMSARKARKLRPTLASPSVLKQFGETHRQRATDAGAGPAAAACTLCVLPVSDDSAADMVAVGDANGSLRVLSGKDLSSAGAGAPTAHAGAVSCLTTSTVHPGLVISGGDDGVACVWDREKLCEDGATEGTPTRTSKRRRSSGASSERATAGPKCTIGSAGDAAVCGVSVHPAGGLFLAGRANGRWTLTDVGTGDAVAGGTTEESGAIASCAVHPDGLLFGLGLGSGAVEMWDVKNMTRVETLRCGDDCGGDVAGEAHTICMSENGYVMVVAGRRKVRVWDLRKLKITRETGYVDEGSVAAHDRSAVALDWSGTLCAASTNAHVKLLETKKLRNITDVPIADAAVAPDAGTSHGFATHRSLPSHSRLGLAWGHDAHALYAGLADGCVVRLASPSGAEGMEAS